jgi:hypothetical protein
MLSQIREHLGDDVLFVLWVGSAILAGIIAQRKGRSFFVFFLIALFISPVPGLIAALLAKPPDPKKKDTTRIPGRLEQGLDVERFSLIDVQNSDVQDLYGALCEAEIALSRYSGEWESSRKDLCTMWRYVLATAPRHLQVIAAKQVAHYFHHKAQLSIDGELHNRVEGLAYELYREKGK